MTTARPLACLGLVASLAVVCAASEPPMLDLVRDDFAHASRQYAGMLDRISGGNTNPRTVTSGRVTMVTSGDWTAGFFPGALWLLYEYTGEAKWRDAAVRQTALVEAAKTRTDTHDLGFILGCSFGQGYRLTVNPAYRDVLLTAAASLSTRYNPVVGCIKSWDGRPQWKYPVIIDNMINLELMMWASAAGQAPAYADIAVSHAEKTRLNHFRADNSSYHVVSYDPATGAVEIKQTAQGAFDESAWARGQSWGLYGYTMMYRLTRRSEYLTQAQRIAAFLMNHPRMPADKVPYWDYDAPTIPNAPRDASAAAIMASALIELGDFVDPTTRQSYVGYAEAQLRSLSSAAYRASIGDNGNFLLMHSTGNLPGNVEIDVPLIYADYYFIEALLRYKARFGSAQGISPVFVEQPLSHTVTAGTTVILNAPAAGSPSPTYAWALNGRLLEGATTSQLTLTATTDRAGSYSCTVTNTAGSATSDPAVLAIAAADNAGRLANLSARANAGAGAQTLIVGFAVGGAANTDVPLLVRGMGASLAAYGVPDFVPDPSVTVFRAGGSEVVAANDNWNGSAALAQVAAGVGAFPFSSAASQEAALTCSLPAGSYTGHLVANAGRTGTALLELYDTSVSGRGAAARLINVSMRAQVGTGAGSVTAGFVVAGPTSRTVLVRGLGPALSGFGVTGVLADPKLRLFRDGVLIAENDNWVGDVQVTAASAAAGAFPLTSAASKDGAFVMTLPPGAYSVQVVGINATTGVALLELYEVP